MDASPSQMTFGERLRRTRESVGMTQEGLGELVGVDRTYINKIENGTIKRPRYELRRDLEAALGVFLEDPPPVQEKPQDEVEAQSDPATEVLVTLVRRVRWTPQRVTWMRGLLGDLIDCDEELKR